MFRRLCFVILFLPLQGIFAQVSPLDNPLLDQVPNHLLNNRMPAFPFSAPAVITIGNWDNFNLGIDLAESNMATNPNHPPWFFTAYNLNGTHHTENGFQWFTNNPDFADDVRGDPVVAYDSLGNLYYMNMKGLPNVTGARVVRSPDNGISWEPAVDAIAGYDKCWMACDQTDGPYANYVYATMSGGNGGNFARSTDHGITFQPTFQAETQSLPGMMVCVGPDNNIQGGAVYVVTNSGSSFASTYTFYRSLNGGETFTQMSQQNFAGYVGTNVGDRNSVENMRTRPYPFIAADNSYGTYRGRLYLIYASNNPSGNGNKPDIFCRFSDNGGINWSAAVRVNDDANSQEHHQWHPATWCDKETGRLYIQWMDTRDTPTSDSALIYATFSDDGGSSFAVNQKISNQKMKIDCSSCGGGGVPRYQGDYNGIVSNRKVSMLGWTDFRDGSFMSTTAYFPDFSMMLDHTADTLRLKKDTARFLVIIPASKLYTEVILVSAEISPVPANGSITIDYPQANTICSFPDTVTVNIILNGSVPTGNYTAVFFARGPNGTPVHYRNAIITVEHGTGYYVFPTSTPDTICTGASAQLLAYVNKGTPPITFSWSPAEGLSDPSIANPIASLTESRRYYITASDAMLNSDTDSVEVMVKFPPVTPGPITGDQEVCIYSNNIYSVVPSADVTSYSWTVPEGASIISGQNTCKAAVRWGTISGSISVIVGNDCGTSNPSVLPVNVTQGPEIPGVIVGPDHACGNGNADFYVEEAPGALSYHWITPPEVVINSGQGTPAINVTWGNLEGIISIFPENDCGHGDTLNKMISLDSLPSQAQPLTGKDTVCQNHDNYLYSIPRVFFATDYVWILPPGSEITSGKGTNEVTLFFHQDAQSGYLSVAGKNDCGEGPRAEMLITVNTCAGISDHGLPSGLFIYPNPVKDELTLVSEGDNSLRELAIMDMRGRIILYESFHCITDPCSVQIDVHNIPRGLYLLKMVGGNRIYYSKLTIE